MVGLEDDHFNPGLLSGRMEEYCSKVMQMAMEHIQFADHYDWMGGYYPTNLFTMTSQYLYTNFIWIVGSKAFPEEIIKDINYLVGILMDYRHELGRAPVYRGMKVLRHAVFFKVA